MSAPSASRALSGALKTATRSVVRSRPASAFRLSSPRMAVGPAIYSAKKSFSTTHRMATGIMPDSENPAPPASEDHHKPTTPTEIDDDTYHQHADQLLNSVHEKAEQIQETREDVEVDYSAGVLSITFPPNGTYILNKQPPNKQIWLSSPITGPKRFDWLVSGESMDQKEGGGVGDWVYLRDGTALSEVLRKELAITVDIDGSEENLDKKSVDPFE